jgi:predicted RNase H-like nuclease (RuvC/YqgF family)
MSSVDSPAALPAEMDRLEARLRRLLDEHDRWRRRARTAEERVGELEAALKEVATGELDPVALAAQARTFERENSTLRKRLADARTTVDRIVARLQFLEEER